MSPIVKPLTVKRGGLNKVHVDACQLDQIRSGLRLTADDEECSCVVIGAITVIAAWRRVSGVLPEPEWGGHVTQVVKCRKRQILYEILSHVHWNQ